jgi:hypothetical protein
MSAGGDGRNMGLSSEIGIGTRIWLAQAADARKGALLCYAPKCFAALEQEFFAKGIENA